jgi:hypothetical protein
VGEVEDEGERSLLWLLWLLVLVGWLSFVELKRRGVRTRGE